jgi:hypothetical protein
MNAATRVALSVVIGLAGIVAGPIAPKASAVAACDSTGANCKIGDTGPGGGVIYYDAGSLQWWGRFLEVNPTPIEANASWSGTANFLSVYGPTTTQAEQRRSMSIGMGATNTKAMRSSGSPLVLKHFSSTEDWFLPSKDELDALYNSLIYDTLTRPAVPVWSSSESETGFGWYQLFQDGTQFTDAQGIIPKLSTNVNYKTSPKHVGSDFAPLPMSIFKVRAFPAGSGSIPPAFLVTAVKENADCSQQARNCHIGDKGPAGGIIVYDAGPSSKIGRYYEIAPQSCELSRIAFGKPALGASYLSSAMRLAGKAIGAGAANSARLLAIRKSPAVAAVADSKCGGFEDWFLPSKDELNEAFRYLSHSRKGLNLTPVGGFQRGYYWTSSDYNGSTAWTQYFADGQQFDRVQTLTGNMKPPARPFMIRPMRRFDEGKVASGIGLKKFLGQSIVISELKEGRCVLGVLGVTTGLAPKTEVRIILETMASSTGNYDDQVVSATVDSKGRFEVRIPINWKEFQLFYARAATMDEGVQSNSTSIYLRGYVCN